MYKRNKQQKTIDMAEDFIVKTVFGTFIIEDCGDKDYDIAISNADSNHYYHIPKGLSESEIQRYFMEIEESEND